ncbi:MAG: hypothetical protein ACKOC5_12395, partial [Chloroflexota bacterium]
VRLRRQDPGLRSYHEPDLWLYHQVRPERYRLAGHLRARFTAGRYSYRAFYDPAQVTRARHLAAFVGLPLLIAAGATIGAVGRDRRVYPAYQNYIYERVLPWVTQWGKLYQRLCVRR